MSRRLPTVDAIAEHRQVLAARCQRCGTVCRPDRAHLVDRAYGGPDTVENLALLCVDCHRQMPSFGPGEGPAAAAWIQLAEIEWFTRITSAMAAAGCSITDYPSLRHDLLTSIEWTP